MLNLQRYLTSASDESSRNVGTPLDITLDADSYDDHAKISFQPAPGEEKEGGWTCGCRRPGKRPTSRSRGFSHDGGSLSKSAPLWSRL